MTIKTTMQALRRIRDTGTGDQEQAAAMLELEALIDAITDVVAFGDVQYASGLAEERAAARNSVALFERIAKEATGT